jgi:mannosyltransferase OCH1-like enzyme
MTIESEFPAKTIHYVWVGGKEKPEKVQRVINSWRKFAPDYLIQEWNETNFDLTENAFANSAYQAGNYAFVSDYIRVVILQKFGGLYLDTDMLMLSPLSDWFDNDLFDLAFARLSERQIFGAGFIYTVPNNQFLELVLHHYANKPAYSKATLPNTEYLSRQFERYFDQIPNAERQRIKIYSADEIYNPSERSKFIHLAMSTWSNAAGVRAKVVIFLRGLLTTQNRINLYIKARKISRKLRRLK